MKTALISIILILLVVNAARAETPLKDDSGSSQRSIEQREKQPEPKKPEPKPKEDKPIHIPGDMSLDPFSVL